VLDIGEGFVMDDYVMMLTLWIWITRVFKYKLKSTKYEVPRRNSIH
jgi:hypothetical protein